MIIASTDLTRIGTFHEGGKQVIKTGIPLEVYEDNSLSGTQKGVNIPVAHNGILTAVIGISGEPDEVRSYAYLAEKITSILSGISKELTFLLSVQTLIIFHWVYFHDLSLKNLFFTNSNINFTVQK